MNGETFIQKIPVGQWLVNGSPKGQPRPRAFVRGARAAVYDPGTAEGWKGEIAKACSDLEGRCLHQCLAVSMTFYLGRPKSHYAKSGKLKPTAPVFLHDKKPDADNLAKAVLDALTGIHAWLDDAQVCELNVRRYYEQPGAFAPGCSIRISELTEATL